MKKKIIKNNKLNKFKNKISSKKYLKSLKSTGLNLILNKSQNLPHSGLISLKNKCKSKMIKISSQIVKIISNNQKEPAKDLSNNRIERDPIKREHRVLIIY